MTRVPTCDHSVRVKVVNRGELSTSLTNRGRSLAQRCPPVQATFIPSEGAAVASASAVAEVGVLAGVLGVRSQAIKIIYDRTFFS